MPLAAVTLEVILDGRRISRWFLIGIILVLFGGFLATGATLDSVSFGLRLGAVLIFLPAAIFAWGSRATVKNLPEMTSLGQATITTFGMVVFALVLYVICNLFFQFIGPYPEITIRHFGLLLIYAWFGFAISQILWIRGVRGLGIGIASFHLNALPFYVMFFLFLLGESWNWQQAIGAVIVTTGVILSQIKSVK
jgi:drug/metabolite transporter (DMT)-like permease